MSDKFHIRPAYGVDIYVTLDGESKRFADAYQQAMTILDKAAFKLPVNLGYVEWIQQEKES